jgi:predicted nucleic acid-binding protein
VYCIDASVLIAVFDEKDKFHDQSLSFFRYIIKVGTEIIIPALALAELAGALARKGNKVNDIIDYLNVLKSFGNIKFVDLSLDLCEFSADIAMQLKVKGSDSVYIAVSHKYGLKLVTNDNQQYERGKTMIETIKPNRNL